MTTLGDLIGDLVTLAPGQAAAAVTDVTDDSRRVGPGCLFVAVKGLTVDGHDFARGAAAAGAVAVVAQRPLEGLTVPCLVTGDTPRALGLAAARLHGEPARRLTLVGITGTNGKTTTTYIMERVLQEAGLQPGVVGTVSYRFAGHEEKAPFTTPTPLVLQRVLGQMVGAGCTHGVLEVSSHALELGRVWGLEFAVAAFTNLTQDHLDLHGSMDAYRLAKLLLFQRHLASGGTAVINLDGRDSGAFVDAARARADLRLVRCSVSEREAEARLLDARHSIDGLDATLRLGREEVAVRSPLLGAYNAENMLLAAACCHALGVTPAQISRGVAALPGVPGRLERVDGGREFAVLVDYAHTPDALERATAVLRPLCKGRLLVVFGCGGDRDRSKRPVMGAAVARAADVALVTSDNPRTEEPGAIIEAIVEGVRGVGIPRLEHLSAGQGYLVQPDRREAIFAAVRAARPGDIVLIAGKGHEDYQILGKTRIHFDDREQAREALGQ